MNKKTLKRVLIIIFIVIIVLACICGYLFMGGKVTDASDQVTEGEKGTKSLVVYFSRMGEIPGEPDAVSSATVSSNSQLSGSDTQAGARMIQQLTGADLYQIKTDRYYRKSFMGTAARAWIENTFDLRPALAAKPESLDQYDTIYVGYPIWWFNAPMAIGTFLESYDLSGKTIVPFCTSQDNDIDITMDYIRKTAGGATVLDGLRIHGMGPEEVEAWLKESKVILAQ